MAGQVKMDLNRRNLGWMRLVYNKCTPTRWARTVSGTIAKMSEDGPITVLVSENNLVVNKKGIEIPIFKSHAYAANLFRSGVTTIGFEVNVSAKEIKRVFDSISDNGICNFISLQRPEIDNESLNQVV